MKNMDFGVKPFKKGLVGVERAKAQQSPPLTQETDIHAFSRLKSVPICIVLRSKTQNIVLKKSFPCRKCFEGALSLAERPLFGKQSPGLFPKFTPAERTACKRFGSCEKV